MLNNYSIITIVVLNLLTLSFAQDEDQKLSLILYGNMLYQHFDYGPNQRASTTGSKDVDRAIFDVPKFIIAPTYYFSKDFYLDAEIEFEHLGTGSAF